jgi:hypothetical protein
MSYRDPPTIIEMVLSIIALTAGGVIVILLILQALKIIS